MTQQTIGRLTTASSPGWLLRKPVTSDPGLHDRLRAGLLSDGYRIRDAGADWDVQRAFDPPELLTELTLRITREGLIGGTPIDLERRLQSWWNPAHTVGNMPASRLEEFVTLLEGFKHPKRDPLRWAKANELAGYALAASPLDRLGEVVVRVERVYRGWVPDGQLIIWERSHEYLRTARLAHILGSIHLIGTALAVEAANANSSWWGHGEDLIHAPLGTLYLDLIPLGTAGVAWETIPYIFLYEFGEYRQVHPAPLDALNLWRLHSYSGAEYTATLPARWRVPKPDWLYQDGLRSWYVGGINRLARFVVSLENFRTDVGRLRPDAQQQAYLTVARILGSSGVLFASWEPHLQRLAFWDLVDLYAGLRLSSVTESVAEVLGKVEWTRNVLPGVATMPGSLGQRWQRLAQLRYERWIRELVAGIVVPSRRRGSWVTIGAEGHESRIRWHEFFTRHLEARRHTLHGYYPQNRERFRDYLAIHDGRLPSGLTEWGRFMFMALLANPGRSLEAFNRISELRG